MSKFISIPGNYKLSVNNNGNIIFDTGIQVGNTEFNCNTLLINETFRLSNDSLLSWNATKPFNPFTTTTQDITIGKDSILNDGINTPLEGNTFLGISPTQEAIRREVVTAEWMSGRSCASQPPQSVIINTTDKMEVVDPGFDWGVYRSALYSLHVTNFIDTNELLFAVQTAKVLVSCNSPLHVSVAMEDSVSDIIRVDSTQGLYPGMTVEVVGCSPIIFSNTACDIKILFEPGNNQPLILTDNGWYYDGYYGGCDGGCIRRIQPKTGSTWSVGFRPTSIAFVVDVEYVSMGNEIHFNIDTTDSSYWSSEVFPEYNQPGTYTVTYDLTDQNNYIYGSGILGDIIEIGLWMGDCDIIEYGVNERPFTITDIVFTPNVSC